MDTNQNRQIDPCLCDGLSQDDMLRILGLDPSVVRWPAPVRGADSGHNATTTDFEPLDDREWDLIAPCLPLGSYRGNAMDPRAFLNHVLAALARGRWTDIRNRGPQSDAVRRRFGRWAHQGVWHRLAVFAGGLEISKPRQLSFEAIARRADMLHRKH